MAHMTSASNRYAVTCLYGLEGELADEAAERLGVEAQQGWAEVTFNFDGPVARLRELRLAGNVFLVFGSFLVGPTAPDLAVISEQVGRIDPAQWESLWESLNGQAPESPEISVSVGRSGQHNFTFKDVEAVACAAVEAGQGRRAGLEARPLELRVEIRQERCHLRGRLSPKPLSNRPYKVRRDRSQTHPALAAAMVRMSQPTAKDRFLDPFCGTGTIAIERALLGPAAIVVGGDISKRRIEWATQNVEAAGAQVELRQWDARELPFEDREFTRIVTNPPQSDPETGRPWRLKDLVRLMAEPMRALEYGGISVWLTRHRGLLEAAIAQVGLNRFVEETQCDWKGKTCHLYVLEKTP
ncbi:MAG: methyltransferase domain-containing protein [Planctomycetes bacterium]|nr:methyltransferase domain-containing protein [Planctomycetota bacterium]